MKIKYCLFVVLVSIPLLAFAVKGPTGIGAIKIGMSKTDYISAIGIKPVNCNTQKDKRSDMKYLQADDKTLCYDFSFGKTGFTERIQVSDISYDVVVANYESSKFIKSIGNSSKAIFVKDRLVSLEIMFPKVTLDTLTSKYGEPKLLDNTKIKICTNRMGNKFKNSVGNVDAVWSNGKVSAILRAYTSSPRETCTDGITMPYYIIEDSDQLRIIEKAINKYRATLKKNEAAESPF